MAVDPNERRVAVIAVHGVGYTEPCATAKHLSDLLLGLGRLKLDKDADWPDAPNPPYREFTKSPLVVPLQRPHLKPDVRELAMSRVADSLPKRLLHIFDERLGYLANAFAGRIPAAKVLAEVSEDNGKIAHEFMRSQLADYVGQEDGRAFDTTCMESVRTEKDGKATRVHVYEAYWADLARPKSSFISFFMAFYQLLFHLSSLSRTAVYYATLEHLDQRRWRVVSFLQAFASRMLALPIPLLNLIMLLAGLTVITLSLPGDPTSWAIVIGAVIGLASVLFLRHLRAAPREPWQWLALLTGAAGTGAAIAYVVAQRAHFALAIEWWLIGGVLLAELFQKYNRVRRRALLTGMALLVASFGVFLFFTKHVSDHAHEIQQASFWTVQIILAALILSWALMLGSAALLWCADLVCILSPATPAKATGAEIGDAKATDKKAVPPAPPDQQGRARAALRTGRLTLAASASMFLLTTVFIWSGLFEYTARKSTWYTDFTPTPPPIAANLRPAFSYLLPDRETVAGWMQRVGYKSDKPNPFGEYVHGLFLIGVTSGLPVMLGLTLPALIILIFAVVPSLMVSRDRLHLQNNRKCETMGNWYSHGLDSSRVVTTLAWHSVFTVALLFGALDFLRCHQFDSYLPWPLLWDGLDRITRLTMGMLLAAGGTLAVSGAALAAIILKYGKTPLDIVLDVDNYLRTSPLDNTPRARIVERYVSLLRYIANRNSEDGTPYYHSIVIGAHSLGALISADLLHFLNREGDPELDRLGLAEPKEGEERKVQIPILLLTFGNPLRQLLTRFFPHLYWWVNATPDNSLQPLPQGASSITDVTQARTPDLSKLQLRHWVSAYRSGDFVGRSVWLNNWYRRNEKGDKKGQPPDPPKIFDTVSGATELCIGIGGHNDYWNRSAPDIALQLDKLICAAASEPPKPPHK